MDVSAQFMRQFRISINSAKIKEDADINDLLRLRFVNPFVNTRNPISQ